MAIELWSQIFSQGGKDSEAKWIAMDQQRHDSNSEHLEITKFQGSVSREIQIKNQQEEQKVP